MYIFQYLGQEAFAGFGRWVCTWCAHPSAHCAPICTHRTFPCLLSLFWNGYIPILYARLGNEEMGENLNIGSGAWVFGLRERGGW